MAKITYHADLKEVQGDPALAALLAAPPSRAPFDRGAWFALLTRHCGLQPLYAAACEGEAAALLPLMPVPGGLASLANWYSFSARPIVSPGPGGAALLAALAQGLRGRAAAITLAPLPDEDGSATAAEAAFRAAGWWVRRRACDTNHILTVGGRDYAAYLADRPGPLRTTLKRKAGKVRVDLYDRCDPAAWAAYEAIYRDSWKGAEGSPAFLRAFAEAEAEGGRLRLGLAHAGGEAVAAQLWTVEHGTAYIHKLAHREAARALSPGTTLSAALFARVIEDDRVHTIDFGTGNDPYKADWMEQTRPRFRLECLDPRAPRAWPRLAQATLQRLAGRGTDG